MNEFGEKVKHFISSNVPELLIVIGCVVRCLCGVFTIERTGDALADIISDSLLESLMGILIVNLFGISGINKGKQNPKVVAAAKLHSDVVDRITPFIDELDYWCNEYKNIPRLKHMRARILSHYGIKYDDVFDGNGVYKDPEFFFDETKPYETKKARRAAYRKALRSYRHKKQGCKRALSAKITVLSLDSLTNATQKENDPNSLGRSMKDFLRKSMLVSIPLAIGVGILFKMFRPGTEYDVSRLFWQVLQVATYCMSGGFKWYGSFTFVVDEARQRTVKQINYLQEFEIFKKNQPKLIREGEQYGNVQTANVLRQSEEKADECLH